MGAIAPIVDGQVANTTSTTEEVNKKSGSTLDKDSFLQLLVAQMKYQDPLEPTSNTEYIAQYATFSQVEQLQNMAQTLDSSSAMDLVGKYVTMDVTTATGSKTTVSGHVDYVEKTSGKTLLYIDGTPYNYENLNTVWDDEYLNAYELCAEWSKTLAALPAVDNLTLDYADSIASLRSAYDNMSAYQKGYIGSTLVGTLNAAERKIAELKAAADAKAKQDSEAEDSEDSKAEETETV